MDDAKQRHYGRFQRQRSGLDLAEPLQEQLPEAMYGGVAQATRPIVIGLTLFPRLSRIDGPAHLGASNAMNAFQQAADHGRRLDPKIILLLDRGQGSRGIAREQKTQEGADR